MEESRPLGAPNLTQETGAHNGAALSARHRMTVINVVEEHARITESRAAEGGVGQVFLGAVLSGERDDGAGQRGEEEEGDT